MMRDRRGFLRDALMLAAASGLPVRLFGAAAESGRPDLRLGVLSDIHIHLAPGDDPVRSESVVRFRKALEYFRDRRVDGVLIAGDLADQGLDIELKAVADTWFGVFPDGKLPDGSPVANLMHYGDHDAEARFWKPRKEDAVRAGYTILSGFISPGEQAVRDMLLENGNATFIHVLSSCLKNGHRPDSRYLKPLQEGRFLEIGEGNDESEFGRAACLALNDEIVKIACAGEGLGIYWREERAWRITPAGAGESGQAGAGEPGLARAGRRGLTCGVKNRGPGPA